MVKPVSEPMQEGQGWSPASYPQPLAPPPQPLGEISKVRILSRADEEGMSLWASLPVLSATFPAVLLRYGLKCGSRPGHRAMAPWPLGPDRSKHVERHSSSPLAGWALSLRLLRSPGPEHVGWETSCPKVNPMRSGLACKNLTGRHPEAVLL